MEENQDELYQQLIEAIKGKDEKAVEELIEKGANISRLNDDFETPLMISIEKGSDAITELLLNKGAKVDFYIMPNQANVETALYRAVVLGNKPIVEKLIDKHANVNINVNYTPEDNNKQRKTVLDCAIERGYNDIAKLLLDKGGANYTDFTKELAITYDQKDVLDLINRKEEEKIKKMEEKKEGFVKEIKQELLEDGENKPHFFNVKNLDNVVSNLVELRMGKTIKLGDLTSEERDDLLLLNNWYFEKNKKKILEKHRNTSSYEITEGELKDDLKKMPVYIRGISTAAGVEKLKESTAMARRRDEWGSELEIRKMVRRKGIGTNTRLKGKYNGNLNKCVSMINGGKVHPFIEGGFGIIKENNEDIKIARSKDIWSGYFPKEEVIRINSDMVDKKVSTIDKEVNKLLKELLVRKEVGKHTEAIMDLTDKDVKFVYWSELEEGTANVSKLKAIYFERKFYEQTGRDLPIFNYKDGDDNYLQKSDFTKEEIVTMLQEELLDKNSNNKELKGIYNHPDAIDFFITFKDEIEEFDKDHEIMGKFLEEHISNYIDEASLDIDNINMNSLEYNVYNAIDLIKFAGVVKGEDYQQEQLKEIFKNLESKLIMVPYISKVVESYSYKASPKRENRFTDLMIGVASEIRNLATDETMKELGPKLDEFMVDIDRIEEFQIEERIQSEHGVSKDMLNVLGADHVFKNGKSLLSYALGNNNMDIVDLMIEKGVNTNILNEDDKKRLLILQMAKGDNIEDNVDVNMRDGNGKTALMYAIENNNPTAVKTLVEHGANVDINTLTYAISREEENSTKLTEAILSGNTLDLNEFNEDEYTALTFALVSEKPEIAKLLINIGADVNKSSEYDNPLKCALNNGYTEVVELLLEKGANTDVLVPSQLEQLQSMIEEGKEIKRSVSVADSEITLVESEGFGGISRDTSIDTLPRSESSASINILDEVLQMVKDNEDNVDVNMKDENGKTALIYAIENNNPTAVKTLVEHGANVDINTLTYVISREEENSTKLTEAILSGNTLDLNEFNEDEYTALTFALVSEKPEIAKLLINLGADVNKSSEYDNPLKCAVNNNYTEVVELLLKKGANTDVLAPSQLEQLQSMIEVDKGIERSVSIADSGKTQKEQGGTSIKSFGVNVKSIVANLEQMVQESNEIKKSVIGNVNINSGKVSHQPESSEIKSQINRNIINSDKVRSSTTKVKSIIADFEKMVQESTKIENKPKTQYAGRNNHRENDEVEKNTTM